MRNFLFAIIVAVSSLGCNTGRQSIPPPGPRQIQDVVTQMTEVMVNDVTNPPLAARFFAYASLAGYEVVSRHNPRYRNMQDALNGYTISQQRDTAIDYDYRVAALLAMLKTAATLQPSGPLIRQYEKSFYDSCINAGHTPESMAAAGEYADQVSKQVLAYAKADRYNTLSNYPRYTSLREEGAWYPTPPAFLPAVEPYFNKVRPFTLDSASQFKPQPPTPFSSQKSSAFYAMVSNCYSDSLTPMHQAIAAFWDCNPFAVQDGGHLLMALKKISPGAHWMGITGIACQQSGTDFDKSMLIHTAVAVGLMDAFMCCWDEKYRSNRIRPETAIRKMIDPNWKPLLQTPPFPEYLSGHSVISAAAATILTHYFGDGFGFTDDVEVPYGLPPRRFVSFQQAAEEAGLSRYYGGIHFMDAIEKGNRQGLQAGQWVVEKLKYCTK